MKRRRPIYLKVGVVAKPTGGRHARQALTRTLEVLARQGVEALLDREAARLLGRPDGMARPDLTQQAEAVVVIGGDGTFLSVARCVGAKGPPLVGINQGTLGFLTEIKRDQISEAIARVLEGQASEERRMMLKVTVKRTGKKDRVYTALNDVVLAKSALARTIRLRVDVLDEPVSTYRSDGLLISTPTGSTAYSLSAGGPLVHPGLDAMLITPICPHGLVNRPLIIPASSRLSIHRLSRQEEAYLTVDGQVGGPFHPGDRIEVQRSRKYLRMLHPFPHSFYATLRSKLKWS
ncbi:MAG: NAD(+)/NADH kinase [Acidobacteriota bacterium]